jgi:hypothetical protein
MRSVLRHRPSPATVISVIALVVALAGTSYAAVMLPKNSVGPKQLKKNAVNSAKVKNHSLKAADFKAGQLPAGPKGDPGVQGLKGDQGVPGTPATKLFGNFNGDNGSLVRGSGIVSSVRSGTGFYTVTFNQDVSNCAIVSSPGSIDSANPSSVTVGAGYLNSTQVFVLIRNDFNDNRVDADFSVAVFC